MQSKTLVVALLTTLLVLSVGCRTAPVKNVENASITTSSSRYSMGSVRQAIERAGVSLGWRMRHVSNGHLVGTLDVRDHTAQVDIRYNRDTYDIAYKDSNNLKYDGEKIHSNYNGWIQNLDRAIQRELIAL